MIFRYFERFLIKVSADEQHVFDMTNLMFSEVQEIEKVSGLSYGEWQRELRRYSAAGLGPLIHVLRKRAGQSSDYLTMQFNMAKMDCVPIREDGTEMTEQDIGDELQRRIDAAEAADPTLAAGDAASESPDQATTSSTSPSSPSGSESAPGNGTSSPGAISSAASPISTPS